MQVKKAIFYVTLLVLPFFSPVSYFEKTLGTTGNDYSRSVKQLPDGTVYLFGNTDSGKFGGTDLSLIKLDKDGNQLWEKYYGASTSENGFYLNTTADANLVFVGEQVTIAGTDIVIYKIDTAGGVIWNKTYSTPLNETANYIEQTNDGGYIIAGAQNDSAGYYDLFILKLNAGGDYQWHKTFGPSQNEYAKMIHQVKDGYILIGDMGDSLSRYDIIVYKLDSAGNEMWSKSYGDSLTNGSQGIITTSDGNYLLYGETEPEAGERFDGLLEKIDPNGNTLWKKKYGGNGADAVFSVKETDDGGFICVGYSNSYNSNDPIDLMLFKTTVTGKQEWVKTYGAAGIDIGYEVIKNNINIGYIITGTTFRSTDDAYLLQLDEKGLVSDVTNPDALQAEVYLFPNPASEKVTVHFDWKNGQVHSLYVMDALDHQMKNILLKGNSGTVQLDITDLTPGIYFCVFYSEDQQVVCKRLVVQ